MAYNHLHAELSRATVFEDATKAIAEVRLTGIELCDARTRDDRIERRGERGELVSRDIGAFRTGPCRKRHGELDLEQVDVRPYHRE
jgi:hypothetical protein